MLSQWIRNQLEQCVVNVVNSLGAASAEPATVLLEQPPNADFGDYSSNIAMQLAKKLRKAPMAIAGLITAEFQRIGAVGGVVQRIEIATPGFINLYINWQEWAGQTFVPPPGSGEKVIIEHTSVNPNKTALTRLAFY